MAIRNKIQYIAYKCLFLRTKRKISFIGKGAFISPDIFIENPRNIQIKDYAHIQYECKLYSAGSLIKIGEGSILANNVSIFTRNHKYDGPDLRSIPYDTDYICGSVEIGENVWVGSNVTILPGVNIGEGAVIGASAVVAKDVPAYAVAVGNPARVVKYRDKNKYMELKSAGLIYKRNL